MRFRNIDNWKNVENLRGLLFFAQRLDELTFEYTLDSYKAPTMSAPALIKECLQATEEFGTYNDSPKPVLHVVDEMERKLKGNPIAKDILSAELERYLTYDRTNLASVSRNLRVLRAELDSETYFIKIVQMVQGLSNTREKRKLDLLAREFAATLQNFGLARSHINQHVVRFFFEDTIIDDVDKLQEFVRNIYPHAHSFDVYLKVSASFSHIPVDILEAMDVYPREEFPDLVLEKCSASFAELRDDVVIHLKKVKAPDYTTAVREARKKLEFALDIHKLFAHKGIATVSRTGAAEQKCCAGEVREISTSSNSMHFIRDRRPAEAGAQMKRFMSSVKLAEGADREKLFTLISFHGMSLSSERDENQILNLWTCFETIVPFSSSQSKVDSVVDAVMPIVSLRYYDRLLNNLVQDLVRWDRHSLRASLKKCVVGATGSLREKVFALVAHAENTDALEDLLTRCRDFELLKYRIFEMASLFRSQKEVATKLGHHEERVRWQFHRIYRTRNSIVHSGKAPRFSSALVENAHDYFDQVFDFCCLVASGQNRFETFSDCLIYAGLQYREYMERIKSHAGGESRYDGVIWEMKANPRKSFIFPELARD